MSLPCDALNCTEGQQEAYVVDLDQIGGSADFGIVVRLCRWHGTVYDNACQHLDEQITLRGKDPLVMVRGVCDNCGRVDVRLEECPDKDPRCDDPRHKQDQTTNPHANVTPDESALMDNDSGRRGTQPLGDDVRLCHWAGCERPMLAGSPQGEPRCSAHWNVEVPHGQ